MFVLAIALVIHGLFGPQFAPQNFASLFVWVHYRGFLVLAVLFLGNLLCGGCPLVLSRNVFRRWIRPKWYWPSWARNKWLSIFLFALVLFLYESLDLWASPFATAVLILIFFAAILLVDLLFKESSFCKYVCPVGQFNFLSSMMSPFQVTVKDQNVCTACTSLACIKGRGSLRGCEQKLFVAKKAGNFDCTFCMDCERACPHDNVKIGFELPGNALSSPSLEAPLAGVGRLWERIDVAGLIVIFLFGAVLNAFAMVGPAYDLQIWLAERMNTRSETVTLFILFFVFLLLLPLVTLPLLQRLSRGWGRTTFKSYHFIPALIPVGLGIWAAHYSFHFLTGALTFVPLLYKALALPPLEPTAWANFPLGVPVRLVIPIQMGMLLLGGLGSMLVVQERARMVSLKNLWGRALPWHVLIVILSLLSAWIFTLPMEMRGTFLG